jgi:hypothetical protein
MVVYVVVLLRKSERDMAEYEDGRKVAVKVAEKGVSL